MSLEEYRAEMETCCRCSACKFVPLEIVNGYDNVNICPSISRYNFHAYSGGGRLGIGVAILEKEIGYSEKLLEVVYNCQMCGGCDVSCKYAMDMEVLEPLYGIRRECVESGHTLPVFDGIIARLRKDNSMVPGARQARGKWSEGLAVKDFTRQKAEVAFHAGCRTSYDANMWPAARSSIDLMQKAGADVGIDPHESCCGGRAYQLGYREDFLKLAKHNMDLLRKSGVKTLVTACAECYHAFKVLYDQAGLKDGPEVLHTSEYFAGLMAEGKLRPARRLDMAVTYHDPCHLGRLGEPYIHWQGKQLPGHIRLFDPPREFRRGTCGVYAPPRDLLGSIPGVRLTEMERIKEYAWCCGAGGGVAEYNPGFAAWTARERIREAENTGAEALVTACPGCESAFRQAILAGGSSLKVYDLVEMLAATV